MVHGVGEAATAGRPVARTAAEEEEVSAAERTPRGSQEPLVAIHTVDEGLAQGRVEHLAGARPVCATPAWAQFGRKAAIVLPIRLD
jgi:hypothetical protein